MTDLDLSTEPGGAPAPHLENTTVRKAARSELALLATALAKAFYDDPMTTWMMPDDARRLERLDRAFTVFLDRLYLDHDETYTTAQVTGAAVWAPPETWKLGPIAQLMLLPRLAAAFGRDLPRSMSVLNFMESKHPHDKHYYLPFIGVEPEWQGKGIGTALLRPILDRCDREGVSAYLEATSPRNRACYLRNGFHVVEEANCPKGGPPFWLMRREPNG